MTATATAIVLTLAEAPGVMPVFVLATTTPGAVIWPCPRCWDEDGTIRMYSHVAGGVCFKCHGFGGAEMTLAAAQAKATKLLKGRITRARKAERERLAKLAARQDRIDALVAQHPGLAELLDETVTGHARPAEPGEDADGHGWDYETDREYPMVIVKPLGDFVYTMATTLRHQPERMTAKRCTAAVEAIAKARARAAAHQAKLAAAGEVPTGRIVITGTVMALWEKEATFGYRATTTLKMRVETTGGWVGIGTVPHGFWGTGGFDGDYRGLKGATVKLTATVEPAAQQREGELPVGWLARPAKAEVLALTSKLTVVE
ncbi:MAG: hypothetical protein H7Y15_02625 [Pseudonocardia sp.]|nr:hypothetical protein [Pseudonocardia sp.]